ATVHFAQTSVLLVWPDGGRMLIGHDGITCRVEPTLYPVEAATLARIDAAVPPGTIVRMPARDPESIPQPMPSSPARAGRQPGAPPRFRRLTLAAAVVLGGLSVLCTLFSAVATQSVLTDTEQEYDAATLAIVLAIFWGATAFVVLLCFLMVRRLRR